MSAPEAMQCSFCGRDQASVRKLIAGPAAVICNECIDACNDIVAEERRSRHCLPDESQVPPRVRRDPADEELQQWMAGEAGLEMDEGTAVFVLVSARDAVLDLMFECETALAALDAAAERGRWRQVPADVRTRVVRLAEAAQALDLVSGWRSFFAPRTS